MLSRIVSEVIRPIVGASARAVRPAGASDALSSVGRECLAGNPARQVRRHEHDDPGYVIGHANTAQGGVIRRLAELILAGRSLGPNPDARVQVIGLQDFVRVTREAAERMACPPTAVNCCHPRVWTFRELADAIRDRLGRGQVTFDRDTGGLEHSAYAEAGRMIEWFGPPRVSRDDLLERVVSEL